MLSNYYTTVRGTASSDLSGNKQMAIETCIYSAEFLTPLLQICYTYRALHPNFPLGLSNPCLVWTSKFQAIPRSSGTSPSFPEMGNTIIRQNCQSCVGQHQPHQNWYNSFSPEEKQGKLWTSSLKVTSYPDQIGLPFWSKYDWSPKLWSIFQYHSWDIYYSV